jgi:hypothetical protein
MHQNFFSSWYPAGCWIILSGYSARYRVPNMDKGGYPGTGIWRKYERKFLYFDVIKMYIIKGGNWNFHFIGFYFIGHLLYMFKFRSDIRYPAFSIRGIPILLSIHLIFVNMLIIWKFFWNMDSELKLHFIQNNSSLNFQYFIRISKKSSMFIKADRNQTGYGKGPS